MSTNKIKTKLLKHLTLNLGKMPCLPNLQHSKSKTALLAFKV